MRVWWHGLCRTEYHSAPEERLKLMLGLTDRGLQMVSSPSADCHCFINSHFYSTQEFYKLANLHPKVKRVYYCWDLYPWQLNGDPEYHVTIWWKQYAEALKTAHEIWVPSRSVQMRIQEICGRDSLVIPTNVRVWPVVEPAYSAVPYVMNVMRPYPNDPNLYLAKDVCREMGIPLVEPYHRLSWDQFRATVLGARLLISAYHEASTGGMTLLEGYAHGIPSLVARSPYNGAEEYLKDRAHYFDWDDPRQFRLQLSELYDHPPVLVKEACMDWVLTTYPFELFVETIANRIKQL